MGELTDADSIEKSEQDFGDVCRKVNGQPDIVIERIEKALPRKQDGRANGTDALVIADEKSRGGVPYDRGWSWMVLIGACLEMTVVIGMAKSSGILFVAFQDHFKSSSSLTSLLSTVQNATYSISALTVMTVFTRRFQIRNLVLFGSSLACLSYIISSQATEIWVLLLSHGVLQGLGTAFMQPTSITILGQYFDKRRGLANSIAVSGGSLGGLCLAPLITALYSTYGYQGCMLILAGIFLQGCVSAALFRPPSFYNRPEKNDENFDDPSKEQLIEESKEKNGKFDHAGNGTVIKSPMLKHLRSELQSPIYKPSTQSSKNIDPRLLGSEPLITGSPKQRRIRTFTESSGTGKFMRTISKTEKPSQTSREFMAGSYMDLPCFDDTRPESSSEDMTSSGSENRKCGRNICKYITNLFDFKLFNDPVFVLMQLSFGLSCSGYALTTVFIAPFARESGVDASGVANIITIFSAIDLCSRIGIGVIADMQLVRRSTIIAFCGMVVSITSFLLKFYTSFGLIVFYAVILGLLSGGYFALFAVVIVDYMTMAKLHSSLGFTTLFHGAFVAVGYIISGVLRDSTGTYVASFYYLGAEIFVGGLLLFLLPYVERKRDRNARETVMDVVP